MANKRIKKKQQKQFIESKLQNKGYTQKDIKRLPSDVYQKEVKRISYNQSRAEKRSKNRNFIKKHNLNEEYKHDGKVYKGANLVDLSPEVLKKFAKLQERRERDRALQQRKISGIMDAGYSKEVAEKYKNKNLSFIAEVKHKGDREVYKANKSLSVLWSDVTGESHYAQALNQYDDISTSEMIAKIHSLHKEKLGTGGSPDFMGVAKIQVSGDKEKLKESAREAYKKGYNKAAVYEGTHLMTSDEFTVRGYANMMLSVMSRAKPEHVIDYYNQLETYAYENLPEIHKQIFE